MWHCTISTLTSESTCLYLCLSIVLLLTLSVNGAEDLEMHAASRCLDDPGMVQVQCGRPNEKIAVKSVSYASAEVCETAGRVDDCLQPSVALTHHIQAQCNGQYQCDVPMVPIDVFNADQQEREGLNAEEIQWQKETCHMNGFLQQNVPMNLFQIKFECHEFAFCNAIEDEVVDLVIATEGWPAKVTTNPTCGCTFSSADTEEYYLNGFTHCNGTVTFVTEEFYLDGTSARQEYECRNTFDEQFMLLASNEPHSVKLSVDVERSDEESSYEISWINIKAPKKRKLDSPIKVSCQAGKLYIKASVQLILKIVIPIVGILLILIIVIYCVVTRRRRIGKDWRARHVRIPPKQSSIRDMVEMGPASRSSSMESFQHKKHQRVDPEGNVDDIGEFAAMIHKQNEERRKQQLEKRQGYKQNQPQPVTYVPPSPAEVHAPSPVRTIQPNRRTQSIGNLRSNRQYTFTDNLDNTAEPKPLAYTKSASQSRASMRSLKRRAPPPPAPQPLANGMAPRSAKPAHTLSTPSVHRIRSRNTSQPVLYAQPTLPPTYHPPSTPQYAMPYAPSPSIVSSPAYSDANSDDDMPILRPGSRTKPGHNPSPNRPAIAPKPKLPAKQNPRYPPSKPNRSITPGELGELQQELDNSD